jgi:hypothetical protein
MKMVSAISEKLADRVVYNLYRRSTASQLLLRKETHTHFRTNRKSIDPGNASVPVTNPIPAYCASGGIKTAEIRDVLPVNRLCKMGRLPNVVPKSDRSGTLPNSYA